MTAAVAADTSDTANMASIVDIAEAAKTMLRTQLLFIRTAMAADRLLIRSSHTCT